MTDPKGTEAETEDPAALNALFSFRRRVVMVTGGCQNFGREISDGFAEWGARLIVTSRTADKARRRAEELTRLFGVEAVGYGLDITDETAVTRAFDAAIEQFGVIDALVNNAGGHGPGTTGTLENEPLETWGAILRAI
jgi:NAD(P)-dependent dehydrogenase (short-subunit alcohol dehydrogenase family)